MTTQQHKQLVKRLQIITVILGASLALISYLVFLNIRTLGVDAVGKPQNSTLSCSISVGRRGNIVVSASYLKSNKVNGFLYRDNNRVATFQMQAAYDSSNSSYYYIGVYFVDDNLYSQPGTYTLKIQDRGEPIDCSGSANIS